jgi:alcohol dehydrogenase
MRAVLVERFGVLPSVLDVPIPTVDDNAVLVHVEATGLCRSDWHGWLGHDPDIELPHIPGHEFAGTVVQIGSDVHRVRVGDRITAPFVCACGRCAECASGNEQTCLLQQQPGFSYWGSFAEYVVIPWADHNVVGLPDEIDFATAAGLGCRVATAYRGIRQVAQVQREERVVVLGCGGVGLSAVMIAVACGAQVTAVDTNPAALALARELGAVDALRVGAGEGTGRALDLHEGLGGEADVVVEALGAQHLVQQALQALRPRGRLVQIGLLPQRVNLDMGSLIGKELRWLGSHGMAARHYPEMLADIGSGRLDPSRLLGREIGLREVPQSLAELDGSHVAGITVIRPHR